MLSPGPGSPVGPVGPVGPVAPVGPAGPVAPVAPVIYPLPANKIIDLQESLCPHTRTFT